MPPRWNPYTYGPPFIVPMYREYELTVRQEPKQARMCGVGGKADRRPIDPPPIVQLRVIDPAQRNRNIVANSSRDAHRAGNSPDRGSTTPTPGASGRHDSPGTSAGDSTVQDAGASSEVVSNYADSYLQNPYYFMFASLAKPDDDAELHWLKDGKTRCTTGSVVSSLYHLKDPQNQNEDAGFFVFPDLSVRTEGSYRLKLSLFEVVDNSVRHCKSIFSAPFYVYTAKKFPGMEESTPLSCSLADQGIKIRIRKDIRVRKRPIQGLEHPLGPAGGAPAFGPGGPLGPVPGTGPMQPLGPVEGINETTPYLNAGGGIPPPPGATLTSPPPPGGTVNIPPPPGATMSIPPPPGATMIPPPPGATNTSENPVQLPIPQPNPHGGLSLPGVDRRSLPMPSAPGIGQGVAIDEDDERPMPSTENSRRRINPSRRASNANDLDDDDDDEYDDQMEEDDDDEYREDGIAQTHLGRRNPSTRHKKTTPKGRELDRRVNKTKHKTAEEEDAMMVDDEMVLDQDSSGRRGNSTASRKGGKDKGSKGREVKRQKTSEEHTNANTEGVSEAGQEEMPAQNQPLTHPTSQQQQPPIQRHYAPYLPPPPHLVWGHPPAVDPALQPPASAPPQNGTSMNGEATNGNGMIYDPRYQQQYYDTSQQQPTQPYQPQGPPPPSAGQYMTPGYPPPPGQYGYSLGHPPPPPGQYPQQYYQPGVQAWGPPPPSMSYPPPQVPVYGHPPPTTNDPYANYPPSHAPPQQQPQQQFQPRYEYGPHPHHHPSMYGPPPPGPHPMQPYYYEQAPSHVPPPQQYAASPTPPTSGNGTTSTAEGTSRSEYSNGSANPSSATGQRSASPVPVSRYSGVQQPPVSHPPPPSHHMGPPHHYYQPMPPPQHYPGPYNLYGVYTANSSTLGASNVGDPWVNPPASSTNWPGNASGDAYPAGTQSQQQTFNQQVVIQSRSQQMSQTHSQPHHGQDRIQLAPLRVAGSITTSSPTTASSATSGGISPTVSSSASHRSAGSDPYPVIRMKSGSQSTVGYGGPSSGQDHDERDRDMDRGRRDDRGKRNPLSIGSIISDETA